MKERDVEEKELLNSSGRDEWQSVPNLEAESDRYRRYVSATFRKDKRVNIRISEEDLAALQKKALEEGIPTRPLFPAFFTSIYQAAFQRRIPDEDWTGALSNGLGLPAVLNQNIALHCYPSEHGNNIAQFARESIDANSIPIHQ